MFSGKNTLTITKDTLINILQDWIDLNTRNINAKVIDIEKPHSYSSTFEITLQGTVTEAKQEKSYDNT